MTHRLALAPIAALLLCGACGAMGPRPIAEDSTRTDGPRRFALTKFLKHHGVSDATYRRAVEAFGEVGVADLVAVNGYYVLVSMTVSMTVNVDRTPIPNDGAKPLPKLR